MFSTKFDSISNVNLLLVTFEVKLDNYKLKTFKDDAL